MSYDDLNLDINTAQDRVEDSYNDCKILSRSVDDIRTLYSDKSWRRDLEGRKIPRYDFCDCNCKIYL